MIDTKTKDILLSKNQINLFGYEHYFASLTSLFKKKKLPNTILLNGQKGSGKATFVYHFINYILSIIKWNSKWFFRILSYERSIIS